MFEGVISGLTQGLEAADATRRLVFNDKELFLYPVMIIAAALAVGIVVFGSLLLSGHINLLTVSLAFLVFYFIVAFISTYFLVAMLINFGSFLENKRIGIAASFKRANQYLHLILFWAVFYFAVMVVIMIIENIIRNVLGNFIGGIIDAIISIAFTVMTLFSVPIIVEDQVGPIEATKRSIKFIKDHFLQTFAGFVYNEIIHLVLVIFGVMLLVAAALLSGNYLTISIFLFVLGLLFIVVGRLIYYVLFNCFKLIVYNYYTGKRTLPDGFTKQLIEGSVKNKKKSSAGASGGIINSPNNPFMPGNNGNI